jgi:hypothetical protein
MAAGLEPAGRSTNAAAWVRVNETGNPWAIMIGFYELAHGQPMN